MKSDPQIIIKHIIKTYYSLGGLDYDELMDVGYLGYRKAEQNYDPAKAGNTEYMYIAWYVRNEINSHLKKFKINTLPLFEEQLSGEPTVEGGTAAIEHEVLIGQIKKIINLLTPTQQYVLTRLFLEEDGVSLAAVGEEMRLSKERIRQIRDKALHSLKTKIRNGDNTL